MFAFYPYESIEIHLPNTIRVVIFRQENPFIFKQTPGTSPLIVLYDQYQQKNELSFRLTLCYLVECLPIYE